MITSFQSREWVTVRQVRRAIGFSDGSNPRYNITGSIDAIIDRRDIDYFRHQNDHITVPRRFIFGYCNQPELTMRIVNILNDQRDWRGEDLSILWWPIYSRNDHGYIYLTPKMNCENAELCALLSSETVAREASIFRSETKPEILPPKILSSGPILNYNPILDCIEI